jgi:hypothetical protein
MSGDKVIPERPESDRRDPNKRFEDFATKVLTVPKSEIDKREKKWQREKRRSSGAP